LIGPVDLQREEGLGLAENIEGQLNEMNKTLKTLVTTLNNSQSSPENNKPVHQIVQILNSHLNSLQWIDQTCATLQHKIQELYSKFEVQKIETERKLR